VVVGVLTPVSVLVAVTSAPLTAAPLEFRRILEIQVDLMYRQLDFNTSIKMTKTGRNTGKMEKLQ
jgi:hypothetical protein